VATRHDAVLGILARNLGLWDSKGGGGSDVLEVGIVTALEVTVLLKAHRRPQHVCGLETIRW
jgi:hypothetical protein